MAQDDKVYYYDLTEEEKRQIVDKLIQNRQELIDAMNEFARAIVPLVEQMTKAFHEFKTEIYYPGIGGRGIKRRDAPIDGTKED